MPEFKMNMSKFLFFSEINVYKVQINRSERELWLMELRTVLLVT